MVRRIQAISSKTWVVCLGLTLLALAIRLAWLGRKSISADEAYTFTLAVRSVEQLLNMQVDPTPPLYYVFMHYWVALGTSEFILRLPAALGGGLAVGVACLLGRRWAGGWTGTVTALLLAVAPIHVWSSQEVRAYAVASAFVLIAVLALTEAIQTGRWRGWVVWVLATMLSLYTHYSTILLLAVEVLVLVPACRRAGVLRQRTLPVALSLACVVLLYLPWLQQVASVFDQVVEGIVWYFDPVVRTFATVGVTITGRQVFGVLMAVIAIVVGVSSLVGFRIFVWWRERSFALSDGVAILGTIAYLIVLVVSALSRGYSTRRQIAVFLPFFLLFVVWGISELRRRNHWVAILCAITLPLLIVNLTLTEWQDWRSMTRAINEQVKSQDIVLLSAPYFYPALDYYYNGEAERVGVVPADVPEGMRTLTQNRARVWLVLCADTYSDPRGMIPAWLNVQRILEVQYSFPGIQLRLYGVEVPKGVSDVR